MTCTSSDFIRPSGAALPSVWRDYWQWLCIVRLRTIVLCLCFDSCYDVRIYDMNIHLFFEPWRPPSTTCLERAGNA